jgi:hypothetical protein
VIFKSAVRFLELVPSGHTLSAMASGSSAMVGGVGASTGHAHEVKVRKITAWFDGGARSPTNGWRGVG